MTYFSNFPKKDYTLELIENEKSRIFNTISIPNIFASVTISTLFADDKIEYEYHNIQDGERPDIVSKRLYGDSGYYWTFFVINEHLRLGPQLLWPLSSKQFTKRIDEDYDDKKALITYDKSLINKFEFGETIQGQITGTTATLKMVRPEFGQMIVSDISGEGFSQSESVLGLSSSDSIILNDSVLLSQAVYQYRYSLDDSVVSSNVFFTEGEEYINIYEQTFYEHMIEQNDDLSRIKILKPSEIRTFVSKYFEIIKLTSRTS